GKPFAPFLLSLVRFWIVDSTTVIAHEVNTGTQYGSNLDYGTTYLDTTDAGSGPFTVKSNAKASMMDATQLEMSSPWLSDLQYGSLNGTNGIYIANIPEPNEYYYMMNTQKPPLDDVHVRMALAYCLNYTGLIESIYPLSTVSTSCVPASVAGYINSSPYTYNVTKAKEELALSKYANNISSYPIDFDWISAVPIRELDAEY